MRRGKVRRGKVRLGEVRQDLGLDRFFLLKTCLVSIGKGCSSLLEQTNMYHQILVPTVPFSQNLGIDLWCPDIPSRDSVDE